jgi:hypothetical protein
MVEQNQKVEYERFLNDLENALGILSQNNNLKILERITDNFISSSQGDNSTTFINFQIQLFELFDGHGNPILLFLKSDLQVKYNGKHKEAFRRLENLRKISRRYLNNGEKAISLPNELNTTFFLYSERHPIDIKMTLINNNQSSFSTEMDFNGALVLAYDLVNNLNDKLRKGNNNINPETVDNYRDMSNQFLDTLYSLIHEKQTENI